MTNFQGSGTGYDQVVTVPLGGTVVVLDNDLFVNTPIPGPATIFIDGAQVTVLTDHISTERAAAINAEKSDRAMLESLGASPQLLAAVRQLLRAPFAPEPPATAGTTADRPLLGAEAIGHTYFNTDTNQLEIWNGTEWVPPVPT